MTLDAGTSAEGVADLQKFYDGNVYHITEVAATPGIDLKVDFVNVTKFNFVNIISHYIGSSTHSVDIQLYHWESTTWHTWNAHTGIERTDRNHSFHVHCGVNYIGTGGDAGKVRVRLNHTMAGNSAHDSYISVVELYDLDYRLDHHWGPWR